MDFGSNRNNQELIKCQNQNTGERNSAALHLLTLRQKNEGINKTQVKTVSNHRNKLGTGTKETGTEYRPGNKGPRKQKLKLNQTCQFANES